MARGSVTWLGGTKWEARVDVGKHPSTGRRMTRSRTVTATDRAAAEVALTRFTLELGLDPDVPATVGPVLEAWFIHTEGRRQAGSQRAARIRLDKHLLPGIGDLPLSSLSVGDLERFYARKSREDKLSAQTIRHLHYTTSAALKLAVRWGWIARNVAADVDLDPLTRSKVEAPPVEVVMALIERASTEAADPRYYVSADLHDFAWLSALTGARDGEVSAIRRRDVDLELGVLTISGSIEVVDGVPVRKEPKTDKSWRRLSLDSASVEMLRRRLATRELAPDGYLFADVRAEPYGSVPVRPDCWSSRWIRLCARAGISGVRLHDLRHWSASALFEDGARVERVSARLGHARTSTTQDVYGHLLRPDDSDMAEGIARMMRDHRLGHQDPTVTQHVYRPDSP